MAGDAISFKFRPEIEGLRGMLVLLVILYHTGFSQFEGVYFSVDIFFLLSGYLMARVIQVDLANSRFSVIGFYERRARRIFPALYLFVFFALIAAASLMPPQQYENMAQNGLWSLALAGNFYFIESNTSYFSPDMALQPFMHLWSLGLEQQYYLLVPLIFAAAVALRRPLWIGGAFLVMSVASFAYSVSVVELHSQMAFYHFSTRLWEFALGSLLALHEPRLRGWVPYRWQPWVADLGALLVVVVFAVASTHWRHPGYPTLLPMLGAALFVGLANHKSLFYRALSCKPLMYIGCISFSLYISHQILFAFARWYSVDFLAWTVYVGLIAVSVVLSALSYRWVEMPFRDHKRIAPANFWLLALVSSMMLGAAATTIRMGDGLPQRLPEAAVEIFSEENGYSHRAETVGGLNCYEESAGGRPCPIGDVSKPGRWLLVGDSHAGALLSSLDKAMAERNVGGYAIIMGACPYARGSQPVGSIGKPCRRRNDWVQEFVASTDLEGVILVGRYHYYLYRDAFDNGEGGREIGKQWWSEVTADYAADLGVEHGVLASFVGPIQLLLDSGKKVVLTYPVPEMGWNVPNYYYKSLLRGRQVSDVSVGYNQFLARVEPVVAAFDGLGVHENLFRVRPSEVLCNMDSGRCSAMKDGKLLYWDDDHLNPVGASLVVDRIVEGMDDLSLSNRIVTRF